MMQKLEVQHYCGDHGYCMNSDASDYVLPNPERQSECMRKAVHSSGLSLSDIDLISTHATSTPQGDIQECKAIREVFRNCPNTYINNSKGFIGHAMGAAGALELAGNLPSFGIILYTLQLMSTHWMRNAL